MFEAFYNSPAFPMALMIVASMASGFIGWTLGVAAGRLIERKEWENVGKLGRRSDG